MALIIGTEPTMEAQATERMIEDMVSRFERIGHRLRSQGHGLTPKQVDQLHATLDRINAMITDSIVTDPTVNGNMTEAAKAIRERMERDQ